MIWFKTYLYSKSKKGGLKNVFYRWICKSRSFLYRDFTVPIFSSDMIYIYVRTLLAKFGAADQIFGATFQTFQSKKCINIKRKNIWNNDFNEMEFKRVRMYVF